MSMNKKLWSFLKYLLLFAIGIALLVLAFQGKNINEMARKIRDANYMWIALSVFFSFLAYVSRAYRWNMLIIPLGYKPKLSSTLYSLMAGYLANLAIPRIGEISRCSALSQAEKIPFNVLVGTVIVERGLDLVLLLITILCAASIEYDTLGSFITENLINPFYGKASFLLNSSLFIGSIVLVFVSLLIFTIVIFKKQNQSPLFNKIAGLIKGVVKGLQSVGKMKNKGLFIAHTLFIWVMYYFVTYACFFSFQPTSELGFKAGMFTLAIGGLGMTAPVQGGIGAYHLVVSKGLTLFGINEADGLAYATIVHTSQTLFVLLMGGLSLIMLFIISKKKISDESSGGI
jgi:uncharacterized protein (TIRG00374 family)